MTASHHSLLLPRRSKKKKKIRGVGLFLPLPHWLDMLPLLVCLSPNCPRASEMLPANGGAGEGCCNPTCCTGDAPEEPPPPRWVCLRGRATAGRLPADSRAYLVWTGTNEAEDSVEAHPSHQDLSPRLAAVSDIEPADRASRFRWEGFSSCNLDFIPDFPCTLTHIIHNIYSLSKESITT